jgi:transcriptional regulator with XRE-family HTH domain
MAKIGEQGAGFRSLGDRAYVSGLELGQRNPTVLTLWHIAKALGVKLRLFFDEEKPRRQTRGDLGLAVGPHRLNLQAPAHSLASRPVRVIVEHLRAARTSMFHVIRWVWTPAACLPCW